MAMNPIPWQEIRREYLDGATYQELGEKYGIAPSTIGRRRHKEGWGGRDDGSVMLRRCAAMVVTLAMASLRLIFPPAAYMRKKRGKAPAALG